MEEDGAGGQGGEGKKSLFEKEKGERIGARQREAKRLSEERDESEERKEGGKGGGLPSWRGASKG